MLCMIGESFLRGRYSSNLASSKTRDADGFPDRRGMPSPDKPVALALGRLGVDDANGESIQDLHPDCKHHSAAQLSGLEVRVAHGSFSGKIYMRAQDYENVRMRAFGQNLPRKRSDIDRHLVLDNCTPKQLYEEKMNVMTCPL